MSEELDKNPEGESFVAPETGVDRRTVEIQEYNRLKSNLEYMNGQIKNYLSILDPDVKHNENYLTGVDSNKRDLLRHMNDWTTRINDTVDVLDRLKGGE